MSALPVVALHGFAGHAESWDAVRASLTGHHLNAITLFGHDSAKPPGHLVAFEDEVARVAAAIRSLGEPVRLCGYSMGGRIALGVLARAPELVVSAVLVGAHAGLTSDRERNERAAADEMWARVLRDEGMAVFAEKWQSQPLFATQSNLDAQALARQSRIRLRHDAGSLALAMTSLGLAAMPSYWDALGEVRVPIDFVVGALDAKFAALAARMNERLGRGLGRVLSIADAGHNVLLERPDGLASIIAAPRKAPEQ